MLRDSGGHATKIVQSVRVGRSDSSMPASSEAIRLWACSPSAVSWNWTPTPELPAALDVPCGAAGNRHALLAQHRQQHQHLVAEPKALARGNEQPAVEQERHVAAVQFLLVVNAVRENPFLCHDLPPKYRVYVAEVYRKPRPNRQSVWSLRCWRACAIR